MISKIVLNASMGYLGLFRIWEQGDSSCGDTLHDGKHDIIIGKAVLVYRKFDCIIREATVVYDTVSRLKVTSLPIRHS